MFRCHELVPKVFPPTRVIVSIKNQLQTWKLDIALFDAFITNSTNLRRISFAIYDLDGAQVLKMVRYFYEVSLRVISSPIPQWCSEKGTQGICPHL